MRFPRPNGERRILDIPSGQSGPPLRWFSLACANLVTIYEKWGNPEKAVEFRTCSSAAEAEPGR
jgi:hypothetical protein